jgi:hypothetical protein
MGAMDQLQVFLESWSNPVMAACVMYIAKSIHDLKVSVAVMAEQHSAHDDRINRLEELALSKQS